MIKQQMRLRGRSFSEMEKEEQHQIKLLCQKVVVLCPFAGLYRHSDSITLGMCPGLQINRFVYSFQDESVMIGALFFLKGCKHFLLKIDTQVFLLDFLGQQFH
jgi:hypothetical protein